MKDKDDRALELINIGRLEKALALLEKADATGLAFRLAGDFWKKGEIDLGIRALNLHDGEYLDEHVEAMKFYLMLHDREGKICEGLKEQIPDYLRRIRNYVPDMSD